jgi:hypothetical protein
MRYHSTGTNHSLHGSTQDLFIALSSEIGPSPWIRRRTLRLPASRRVRIAEWHREVRCFSAFGGL